MDRSTLQYGSADAGRTILWNEKIHLHMRKLVSEEKKEETREKHIYIMERNFFSILRKLVNERRKKKVSDEERVFFSRKILILSISNHFFFRFQNITFYYSK